MGPTGRVVAGRERTVRSRKVREVDPRAGVRVFVTQPYRCARLGPVIPGHEFCPGRDESALRVPAGRGFPAESELDALTCRRAVVKHAVVRSIVARSTDRAGRSDYVVLTTGWGIDWAGHDSVIT